MVVLDDLSTGFADNIPAGVEFHQLSVHEVGRVLTPDAGFEGVLHFAGQDRGRRVGRPPRPVLGRQRGRHDRGADRDPRGGHAAADLLLDRVDVRPGRGGGRRQAGRGRRRPAEQPLRRHQARGRPDAGGGVRRVRARRRVAALLQRLRRGRPAGRAPHPGVAPDPDRARRRGRPPRRADAVRRRLPDPRRHLRPRLHPRRRPGHRAPARAGRDQAGPARDLQPRQRRRLQQQAGHRGGPRGNRPPGPGQALAPPPGRRRRHRRRQRQGPPRAGLAPGPARSLHDIIADAWSFHQSAW